MTLQYMDSLFQQDNLQKSKFFKGLPKIILKLPKVNFPSSLYCLEQTLGQHCIFAFFSVRVLLLNLLF